MSDSDSNSAASVVWRTSDDVRDYDDRVEEDSEDGYGDDRRRRRGRRRRARRREDDADDEVPGRRGRPRRVRNSPRTATRLIHHLQTRASPRAKSGFAACTWLFGGETSRASSRFLAPRGSTLPPSTFKCSTWVSLSAVELSSFQHRPLHCTWPRGADKEILCDGFSTTGQGRICETVCSHCRLKSHPRWSASGSARDRHRPWR